MNTSQRAFVGLASLVLLISCTHIGLLGPPQFRQKWMTIRPGMTRDEVQQRLGRPTEALVDINLSPSDERWDSWLFGGHYTETSGPPVEGYIVHYDSRWRVKSVWLPHIKVPHTKVPMRTIITD